MGPHSVVGHPQELLCGLVESFAIQGIGPVRIGSEVTEIAVDQATQPGPRDRFISGIADKLPGRAMPLETRLELVRLQWRRQQRSRGQACVLYAADGAHEIERSGLERRPHDGEGFAICRSWKATNLGVPEAPAKDATGGEGVANGQRKLTERLGRSAQLLGHDSPGRSAPSPSDDGSYAAGCKI